MIFNNIEEVKKWMIDIGAFNEKGSLTSKASLLLKRNEEMLNSLKSIVGSNSNNPSELLYNIYNPEMKGLCEVCGKETKFVDFVKGYRKSCSRKCSDILTSRNGKETKERLYGNCNYNNSTRAKLTKEEKYGTSSYNNPDKIKQTKLERYGDENFNNKEKYVNTSIERFGVDNPAKSEEIKRKTWETNLSKYGVRTPMESPTLKEKFTRNFNEKYGCDWPQQNEEIHRKTTGNHPMSMMESKMFNFLRNRNIQFEMNYYINESKFDFALFKNNKLSALIKIK